MAPLLDLPPGLTSRPLTLADAAAVTALIVAEELEDLGTAAIDEADILGFWGRPSFDLGASTVGAFDGQTLVAYAELVDEVFAAAAVHPTWRRRGLGTALAAWIRAVARDRGLEQIGTQVAEGRQATDSSHRSATPPAIPPGTSRYRRARRSSTPNPRSATRCGRLRPTRSRRAGPSSRTRSWSGPHGSVAPSPTGPQRPSAAPTTNPGSFASRPRRRARSSQWR